MKQQNETQHSTLEKNVRDEVISSVRVIDDKGLVLGFAESCTGGLLSSYLTELSGVSKIFMGSVVSYDNKVKQKFLGVSAETLKTHGAVSTATAAQMATGALQALDVSVAVAVTGIAGPSGGTPQKPVGTVFIATAGLNREVQVFEHHFEGDRKAVQLQTCLEALKHLQRFIKNEEQN